MFISSRSLPCNLAAAKTLLFWFLTCYACFIFAKPSIDHLFHAILSNILCMRASFPSEPTRLGHFLRDKGCGGGNGEVGEGWRLMGVESDRLSLSAFAGMGNMVFFYHLTLGRRAFGSEGVEIFGQRRMFVIKGAHGWVLGVF